MLSQLSKFFHRYSLDSTLFIIYAYLCFLAFILSHHGVHISLIWNIFLAVLPLVLANLFVSRTRKFPKILFLILWLLFLPNAFYVLTDFIHLTDISFFTDSYYRLNETQYILDITPWIELLTIALGFLIATYYGVKSSIIIFKYYFKQNPTVARVGILIVAFLVGLATYIGRFLRFNSWDILHPIQLISDLAHSFSLFAFQFTCLFAFFFLATFLFALALSRQEK